MAKELMARQQSGWLVVCNAPDFCKTPMGASTPPVPYMVTAQMSGSADVAQSVRSNGHPVLVLNHSEVPNTMGDQAGAAKGVKSGTMGGKCYPAQASGTVRAEKRYLVRHGDKFEMNAS